MVEISFKAHSFYVGRPLWSSTPGAIKPSYVTGTTHHTALPIRTVTKYKVSVSVWVCQRFSAANRQF